ncbi:hypothetical protein [Aquimarina pacifica]|uniref:hypothetical protein n=1 Tax=Aquimarina pacifica TaxID=1296415 RepID=UPI00046FA635|nr:hypothetical protein [Aquimarina pacifica]
MKLPQYLLVFIFLSFTQVYTHAQEENGTITEALNTGNIETQFNTLIEKSGRFQDYKVVKRVSLDKLKSNTIDTLKTLASKLNKTNLQIAEQKTTITGLEETLVKTNESLTLVTQDKDSMSFLGMAVTKSSYNTILFSIIGVLLILLGIFIFKFKNSNAVTVQAKKALSETEEEFEDHRRRSLEREQKVMRKLQDEINKQRKAGTK